MSRDGSEASPVATSIAEGSADASHAVDSSGRHADTGAAIAPVSPAVARVSLESLEIYRALPNDASRLTFAMCVEHMSEAQRASMLARPQLNVIVDVVRLMVVLNAALQNGADRERACAFVAEFGPGLLQRPPTVDELFTMADGATDLAALLASAAGPRSAASNNQNRESSDRLH